MLAANWTIGSHVRCNIVPDSRILSIIGIYSATRKFFRQPPDLTIADMGRLVLENSQRVCEANFTLGPNPSLVVCLGRTQWLFLSEGAVQQVLAG